MLYQGGPIDHFTHVPGIISQYSAESEYNVAFTAVMALSHLGMISNELLNKDTYVVQELAPIIILDRKLTICMDNNGKDTKHTIHIVRRMNFVRNSEECNFHKTVWCERGLKLSEI